MHLSKPFQVQSYIGSEIAQMRRGGERPPRSAQVVASLDMGSGPGGGDYRTYLLSFDEAGWTLWQEGTDYDTGEPLFCRVAYGWPYQEDELESAAERLLTRVWEDELAEGTMPSAVGVVAPGLLTEDGIARLALRIFGV